MTDKETALLRKAWSDKGNPPCDHPSNGIDREYINGAHSDYVCTTCGECRFTRESFKKVD